MIDIHCHLLPGIDDGPETLEQSLELARLACENGITHAVVTPHIHPRRYSNTRTSVFESFQAFKDAVSESHLPLKLGFAGEVRLGIEMMPLVESGEVPFYGRLGDYQVMLLEFPHAFIPPGSDKLVRWLLDRKILPLIAHPERNKDIMRKQDKILPFLEMGCLLQLTAGSVAGNFGEPARARAIGLLETGNVTLLASDAHNSKYRPPRLDHGRDAAAEIVGDELANKLVLEGPRTLVEQQFDDLAGASP